MNNPIISVELFGSKISDLLIFLYMKSYRNILIFQGSGQDDRVLAYYKWRNVKSKEEDEIKQDVEQLKAEHKVQTT